MLKTAMKPQLDTHSACAQFLRREQLNIGLVVCQLLTGAAFNDQSGGQQQRQREVQIPHRPEP